MVRDECCGVVVVLLCLFFLPCCHESRITAAICRPLPTPVPSPMKKPQRVPSGFFDSKRCPAYTTASSCTRGREEKREVSAEG